MENKTTLALLALCRDALKQVREHTPRLDNIYVDGYQDGISLGFLADNALGASEMEADEFLEREIKKAVDAEKLKWAQEIFRLHHEAITDIEELDRECPEDEPYTYCVHDLRATTFNILYEFMHTKLGYHIQAKAVQVDDEGNPIPGRESIIEGPLFGGKNEKKTD
jgi:hypothetical protein